MSPSSARLWSRRVRGQSGLRSWLCTCQGQEPGLKKEPWRNQQERPAGALHRSAARLGGSSSPRSPDPPVRPFKTWGVLCRSGCLRVPAPTPLMPPPILGSGGVVWRGGGFKSPRVSDRSDRSPNSSQALVPLCGSERPSSPALPWIRRRLIDFHSAWSLSSGSNLSPAASPAKARFSGSGIRSGGFSSYSAVGFTALPTCSFLTPPGVWQAQWTPESEVKGVGIVCCDPSESLLAAVT